MLAVVLLAFGKLLLILLAVTLPTLFLDLFLAVENLVDILSFQTVFKVIIKQRTVTNFLGSNICCASNKTAVINSQNYCCNITVVGGVSYTWAKLPITGNYYECCDSRNVVSDASGNKYCCPGTNYNYTTSTTCCPSANMLFDSKSGAWQCCSGAVDNSWVYGRIPGSSSYQCCPFANSTVDASGNKFCCSTANNNYTSEGACCAANNVLTDTGFTHCCSTPVNTGVWNWALNGTNVNNSTCCPSASTTTDGTNKYCCSANTTWTQNSNCCPASNALALPGVTYCCSMNVSSGGYSWAMNASNTQQSYCCNNSFVTTSNTGNKYCCTGTSKVWTAESNVRYSYILYINIF